MNQNFESRETTLFDRPEKKEEVIAKPQEKQEKKSQTSNQVLGDLSALINQGKITEKVKIDTGNGIYIFEMRTLSGQESTDVLMATSLYNDLSEVSALRIECLSRSIEKINGVPVEKMAGAEGETNLEKRKSIIRNLQQQLLVKLYSKYEILAKRSDEILKIEEDDLKK